MMRTLLLLLLCLSGFAADQLPTVVGGSGLTQNLQAGDRLKLPTASGGFFAIIDPGAQTAARIFTMPVTSADDTFGMLGVAQTFTAKKTFPASTTAAASLTLPHGVAPTSPVNGDLWTTTAGIYGQVNGVTVGPLGTGGGGGVTSVAATVPSIFSIAGSPITTSGTLAMTYSGTALPIANGGTGQTTAAAAYQALSPITTLGDLTIGGASGVPTRLAGNVTTARQFLAQTGNGSVSAAPLWVGPLSLSDLPATLPGSIIGSSAVGVTYGGTGLDASAAGNGKLLIGTGTGLALANLTAGSNITITNASGGITIASSGGGSVPTGTGFTHITSGAQDAAARAVALASADVSGTLPIANGGTNSTTAPAARLALGVEGLTTVADTAYTALATDRTISYTSITASRIVTLPAASTVNLGQWYEVNDASGSVTNAITISIARNGSDTIEGGTASWVIRNAGGYRRFYASSTTNWKLVAMSEDVQTFTGAGSYTWTKEPGARSGFAEGIGGGGGGGSGAVEASGTAACGGGGGGGAGYSFRRFNISDAGATETAVVGAGGTSGAAQATNSTNGNAGGTGGDSTFGSSQLIVMRARGGGGGAGGTTATGTAGLPGGGVTGGVLGSTAGAAGAAGNNLGNIPSGNAGGGGAGAGGVTTAGTPFQNGGFGGPGSIYRTDWGNAGSQGNTRGAADGASGGSPTDSTVGAVIGGPGGGGGASSILTNGGAGGTGAKYGGAGGGGGGALNTHSSGAGGAGGEGIVIVRQTY